MVRGTPAPFAYSLHMSRGSKRIVMVAFTRFHLVQRWNPPSIPRRCSNAIGGYRGLEHTPRWKGVGMPLAWCWKVVGRDDHEFGPVARCERSCSQLLTRRHIWLTAIRSAANVPEKLAIAVTAIERRTAARIIGRPVARLARLAGTSLPPALGPV